MARRSVPLGSVLDLVQPDHPWFDAMTRPLVDAVAEIEKGIRDAAAARRRAAAKRQADDEARTRGKVLRATAEREGKPDMVPGVIARYAARNEITKTQATAAVTLRRDFWIGEGGEVRGRLVSSYGDAPMGGAGGNPPYSAGQSRAAYEAAMASAGPELAPILVHVVIEDRSAGSWAEARGAKESAAAREGLITLRIALNALARHYGLVQVAQQQAGAPIAGATA